MRKTRPSSDPRKMTLRLTGDGKGDLAVLGPAADKRRHGRSELYRLLGDAEGDVGTGDRGIGVPEMRRRLKSR